MKLSHEQPVEMLGTLKARFENNVQRHTGLDTDALLTAQ